MSMKNEPLHEYKLELKDLKKEFPKTYSSINCPSCGADVPADNLNIHDKIGKCGDCNVVFSLEKDIASLGSKSRVRDTVIRPAGVEMYEFEDELDFTLQQPISPLEIIGLSIAPLMAFITFALHFKKGLSILWMMPFLAAALYFIYSLINRSAYKMFVTVDQQYLNVRYSPKNLQTEQRIAIQEIDQLYIKGEDNGSALYAVVNRPEGQKHIRLIRAMSDKSKPRFVEQEIERFLNIPDREIPEES